MCQIALCLEEKWTPEFKQKYRPPKGGWAVSEVPAALEALIADDKKFEMLVWAWRNRPKRRNNSDWNGAVQEMTELFRLNGVTITPEIRGAIRFQGQMEWCAAEPERCPKGFASAPKAFKLPEKPLGSDLHPMVAAHVKSKPKKRCCGG